MPGTQTNAFSGIPLDWQVEGRYLANDLDGAELASKRSRKWAKVAITLGIVIGVAVFTYSILKHHNFRYLHRPAHPRSY